MLVARCDANVELMIFVFLPDASEALSIFRHAFPADGVAHPCLRHEIAFVARIEKQLRAKAITVCRGYFLEHRTFLDHSSVLSQSLTQEYADSLRLCEHVVQHFFGDPWLGIPPERHPVLSANSLIDLERGPADDDLGAVIRGTESAGDHPPAVGGRLDQR